MTSTLFAGIKPDVVTLVLPFPPTVNTYWRSVYLPRQRRSQVLISERGRTYRKDVIAIVKARQIKPLLGDLRVDALFNPPDRLRRDLDNLPKALLDALAHAGLFEDDSQIREMHLRFGSVLRGGQAVVRVSTMGV